MAEAKPKTVAQQTMTIILPRLQGKDAPKQEFYSVNGKNYIIERGKPVTVPLDLYEVIMNGWAAEDVAYAYSEEQIAKSRFA